MIPRVTVLQLDTRFPRIPGDVACVETYARGPQIIRVDGASVGRIVTDRPQDIDITSFEAALAKAEGDIIVTSCGFLSHWQGHLATRTDRPFISSALTALDHLHLQYKPEEICILTFDAARLNANHLGQHRAYTDSIIGLPASHHLRQVITQNLPELDADLVRLELSEFVATALTPQHRHIVLECTNLPPYRMQIAAITGLPVTDILTQIEATCPGALASQFS